MEDWSKTATLLPQETGGSLEGMRKYVMIFRKERIEGTGVTATQNTEVE